MGKKDKKDKKKKRVVKKTSESKLPSSVQALLGYLGGGGPTPMYQQPVNLQRERAGVDSIETLSQIIRQQNLMNASYMQNMERLAFKNEIQDQLKKQGEEQKKEIKEAREEQKQEISKVVVQTQEATKEAIQATTERTLDQDRQSIMRSINYYRRAKKPEKLKFYEEQLRIIDGSIRNKSLADLRSSLQYQSPFVNQAPSYSNLTTAEVSSPGMFNDRVQERGPTLFNSPAVIINPAMTAEIVNRLPPLDPNNSLQKQFVDQTRFIEKQVKRQGQANPSQEIGAALVRFEFNDANSSSGTLLPGRNAKARGDVGAQGTGKFSSSNKIARSPQ